MALAKGLKIEICYSGGVLGTHDANSRRNLIGNATSIVRATRGRGIVISSEARRALGVRGPWDVVNLATVWGMGPERGKEAIGEAARDVVVQAEMKRRAYRGVVDVVYGGEKPVQQEKEIGERWTKKDKGKRKADAVVLDEREVAEKPLSKTQMKKRAKRARLEAEETAKAGEAEKTGEEKTTEDGQEDAQVRTNQNKDILTTLIDRGKGALNGDNKDPTKTKS